MAFAWVFGVLCRVTVIIIIIITTIIMIAIIDSLSCHTFSCSARSRNVCDSSIDLLKFKVGIPKLSAESRIDRISCSILELTMCEVRMVLIVGIVCEIPLHPTEIAVCSHKKC